MLLALAVLVMVVGYSCVRVIRETGETAASVLERVAESFNGKSASTFGVQVFGSSKEYALKVLTTRGRVDHELSDTNVWGWSRATVRVSVPYQVAWTIPLDRAGWTMTREPGADGQRGDVLVVTCPAPRPDAPALAWDRAESLELDTGFFLREGRMIEQARNELSRRATALVTEQSDLDLIDQAAAAGVERMVREWVLANHPDAKGATLRVRFLPRTPPPSP